MIVSSVENSTEELNLTEETVFVLVRIENFPYKVSTFVFSTFSEACDELKNQYDKEMEYIKCEGIIANLNNCYLFYNRAFVDYDGGTNNVRWMICPSIKNR